ncbi:MAG: hypothetical protein NVSMB32_04930 [Actinomycetota bacterium]
MPLRTSSSSFPVSKVLLLIAVLCFVLAAFGVTVSTVNLTDIGLAFGFASFLV